MPRDFTFTFYGDWDTPGPREASFSVWSMVPWSMALRVNDTVAGEREDWDRTQETTSATD